MKTINYEAIRALVKMYKVTYTVAQLEAMNDKETERYLEDFVNWTEQDSDNKTALVTAIRELKDAA